jgi:predicted CXXCH cytochrome family protein
MMRHRHAGRVLFALLFALGLVFGAASAAYASTESTYAAWVSSIENSAPPTPHKGYTTTSTKCAVCHAVHKAPSDGELLLRSTVGQACVYCHIDTAVGGVQIYDGRSELYEHENKKNHSLDGGAPCTGCHSVHGADTYGGSITVKILKRLTIQPSFLALFQGSGTPDPDILYEAVGVKTGHIDEKGHMFPATPYEWEDWNHADQVQQTAFCTGCHPYYTRQDGTDPITVKEVAYQSHPMKRSWNAVETRLDGDGELILDNGVPQRFPIYDFQAPGASTPPAGTRVAGMSTNGCYRCHGENTDVNLGVGVHASSFPHYTEIRERFLMSADLDGEAYSIDGEGRNTIPIPTPDSRQDGTCFYCHLWDDGAGAGVEGVGVTY